MYYPCRENKGADELRSYCEADLRLCFLAYADCWFSHEAAQMIQGHPQSFSEGFQHSIRVLDRGRWKLENPPCPFSHHHLFDTLTNELLPIILFILFKITKSIIISVFNSIIFLCLKEIKLNPFF